MITPGELRKGLSIELDGELWQVLDWEHNKMGRGGALVRLKLRNWRSDAIIERTFSANERFRRVFLDQRTAQFLYAEEGLYHFMDTETYEQFALSAERVGDQKYYLKEGLEVSLLSLDNEVIGIELPPSVQLRVAETEPSFRGDTASGGGKPAVLETGLRVNVPFFVNRDEVIRVDTRTGQYLERVG